MWREKKKKLKNVHRPQLRAIVDDSFSSLSAWTSLTYFVILFYTYFLSLNFTFETFFTLKFFFHGSHSISTNPFYTFFPSISMTSFCVSPHKSSTWKPTHTLARAWAKKGVCLHSHTYIELLMLSSLSFSRFCISVCSWWWLWNQPDGGFVGRTMLCFLCVKACHFYCW